MFDAWNELTLVFERPWWLLLLLLIVPAYFIARHSIGGLSARKAYFTFLLRAVVILLLAAALAEPSWSRVGRGLNVTVVLDRSHAVPTALKNRAEAFLRQASEIDRSVEDRLACITVGRDAVLTAMPHRHSAVNSEREPMDLAGLNLADAVRLALAIQPEDQPGRILIASDFNETDGLVMSAAEVARANGIPIDVLVLAYEHANEVIFDRMIAPARAREGEPIELRMVLRSTGPASGTLNLNWNGVPVDISPGEDGTGMPVEIEPGPSPLVVPITLTLDRPGPQRFEAFFEPDEGVDNVTQNNRSVAVTFVGGEGRVMVVDGSGQDAAPLVNALEETGIAVDVIGPSGLPADLVGLSGYDAVVLCNVPRSSLDNVQDQMLHAYVHDLGGGLVMTGGPGSFGAGGWLHSSVKDALPVELDPPHEMQMTSGALALLMHSCEIPQANYWSEQIAIAAVEALSARDWAGVIVYDWGGGGSRWTHPMNRVGDGSAITAAIRAMTVGDMPSFLDSMTVGLEGLKSVPAGQKHMIIVSDGDPSPPSRNLLDQYNQYRITVTTVMVAGHGSASDRRNMQLTAQATGGEFYEVRSPRQLPEIFIKEARFVARSLIVEGETYQPQIVSRTPGAPIDGFSAVPQVAGYVLTAPRDGLAQVPIVNPTTEGNDPIYAYWNYGLGKSIAYTSDLTGRWGGAWVGWPEFRAFWDQSIRWVMRPSSPTNLTVTTSVEGETATVEVEALDANAGFLNYLQTNAVVLSPQGEPSPLSLQQVGPGRYRGTFRIDDEGAYLVNVAYADRRSDDGGGRGNVQAAVTVPYAPVYRAVRDNRALAERLADFTGGRVLAMDDPVAVDMFSREQIEPVRSSQLVWHIVAIIAAIIFLLDVAARRLQIEVPAISAAIRRMFGQRAQAGGQTMDAWRRARGQAAHRRGDDASDRGTDASRKRAGEADAIDADRKFEAGEGESVEFDVTEDTTTSSAVGTPSQRSEQPRHRDDAPDESADDDDDAYTSRLLRAKRRARGSDGDDDNAGNDTGGKPDA